MKNNLLKTVFALSLLVATNAIAAPKNILIIIADDYGVDSSSLYNSTANGATLPPTPNIASLASNGVVFANAYANPLCSPTRASIITGRHAFRTGVGNVITGPTSPQLSSGEFTLPEAFNASGLGYHLAQFGKWHLATAPNSPSTIGGWTNYAGNTAGAVANYTNWTKTVNGSTTMNYTNYATTDLVNDATSWIQARGTNAWLCWVAFNAPHTPLHKPPTNLAPTYASLPGTTTHINNNPALYFNAMIEAMDTEIGRLLASVNLTNTHVIFIGDNGTTPNTLQPPFPSGRGKNTLYEGGIKVPLVVSSPLVTNKNSTNATPVHAVDLFATILEFAGTNTAVVPTNVVLDSRSFVSTLSGSADSARRVYSELFSDGTPGANDGRALRDARHKIIQPASGTSLFYDLQIDPYEVTNLFSTMTTEQRAHYDRLQFQLNGYSTNTGGYIASATWTNNQFSCTLTQAASYTLWRCEDVANGFWSQVTNAIVTTNGSNVTIKDVSPLPDKAFYSVVK